jgi:hypothetical protein
VQREERSGATVGKGTMSGEGSPARHGFNSAGSRGRVGGWALIARNEAPMVVELVTVCADCGCAGGDRKRVRWAGRKRTSGATA